VSHRLPQSEIDAALAAAGLVALEPYASRNAPLKCRCLRCDSIVSPRLGNIKSAGQGGCKVCAGRQSSVSRATPPEERARLLAAVGLVEVGGYRNALTRVTCRCLRCGRTVRVRLSDIRGGSGCSHCSPSGFDSTSPARVYLLRHDALDAIKVGVCGVGTSRIAQHQRRGWTVVRSTRSRRGVMPWTPSRPCSAGGVGNSSSRRLCRPRTCQGAGGPRRPPPRAESSRRPSYGSLGYAGTRTITTPLPPTRWHPFRPAAA
jgi:hypothetical protein